MTKIYQKWNRNLEITKKIFDESRDIISDNDLITQEYFGINSIFIASKAKPPPVDPTQISSLSNNNQTSSYFEDFLALFEKSL